MANERSKLPPTEKQLERIAEFIEHAAIAPHLDSVMRRFDSVIKTRGGAGVMLKWLREEIYTWEQNHTQ